MGITRAGFGSLGLLAGCVPYTGSSQLSLNVPNANKQSGK